MSSLPVPVNTNADPVNFSLLAVLVMVDVELEELFPLVEFVELALVPLVELEVVLVLVVFEVVLVFVVLVELLLLFDLVLLEEDELVLFDLVPFVVVVFDLVELVVVLVLVLLVELDEVLVLVLLVELLDDDVAAFDEDDEDMLLEELVAYFPVSFPPCLDPQN